MNVITKGLMLSVLSLSLSPAAWAQTSYSSELVSTFTNWCTVTQGQPATVCSCALDKAVQQIPAAALASYLAAPTGAGGATATSSVGVSAVQIVTACASGSSAAGVGAAVGAATTLGSGLFGK